MSPAPTSQLLNRLRMRQVSLLLAIGRLGTLRAAAAEMGMTQPAATKMLHELESALGHDLFERAGRGLRLTDAGRCVLAYFQGMQGSVESLTRELAQIAQGHAGKLYIGSIMAASPKLLSRALIEIKHEFPLLGIEITVDTSDRLIAGLRRGELDLVIGRVAAELNEEFDFTPVAEEALSIVAAPGHPLAGKPRVPFTQLLRYPWILQAHGSPMRDVLEQEFRSHRARMPLGLVETSSILTTMNLLVQSDMLAVIPAEVALRYEQHGMLARVRYEIRNRLDVYGVITARGRPLGPLAARLVGLLGLPRESSTRTD